ncbi:MAG TPA: hypothetical protein VGH40_05790 [Roseiarcus sp.]|jgi:hypothetical protein
MYAGPRHDRDRIDGLAAFAAAAFLTGMGLVAALARVGAPDHLVEALGPLIALVGLLVIGALTRTARLADFLAARRAMPPLYGGLAFAATAAGSVLALAGEPGRPMPVPGAFVALGLVIAALIVGPLLRAANASAVSDILATRFPIARWPLSLVLWVCGLLATIAGLDAAVDVIVAHVGQSRRAAEIIVAIALAVTVVPGGLKGLLWSDAASAGGALAIAAIGSGLAWLGAGAAAPSLAWLTELQAPADAKTLLLDAAVAFGVGTFFVFLSPAIGAPPGRAMRTGLSGLLLACLAFALGAASLAAFGPRGAVGAPSPAVGALVGAATWLPALALARAGVLGASRAAGVDLATAYGRLAVLASARIARARLMMLTVIAIATAASDARLLSASQAIVLALSLNLALVAPSLALAAATRWRSPAAYAALAAGATALVELALRVGVKATAREILVSGLIAGAAALIAGVVAGAGAAWAFGPQRRVARADPFSDLPFEAND